MSSFDVDIPDTAFDGPAADTTESPAEVQPVVPAAETAPNSTETGTVEAPEPDMFPRDYVEKLRQGEAKYRTEAKVFKEAFDGIDESDRDVFLGLAQMYKTDPIAAAREMSRLAQGLMGEDEKADIVESAEAGDEPKYLTREDYENLKREEQVAAQAAQIRSKAESLGYKSDTAEYQYLLAAAKANGGDLDKAHEYIESQYHARVSKYVQGKEAEAASSVTPPGTSTAPVSGERPAPKTWREVENLIDGLEFH